ncbi:minor capsid protein [Capybara microvirus Cap1_SP_50]|nr:DNA pilot protein [Apis mellifera associated microvirus 55]QCS35925.1 minor capsid protein [Capybara microvirus Cap1_SP_50]
MSTLNTGISSGIGSLATAGLSAGISAGSNLMSGLLNQAFYKRNLERQISAQKEMMDYQNQMQKDLMLNEDKLKVGSLRAAGLNPAMLASSSSGNVAVPGAPSVSAPVGTLSTNGIDFASMLAQSASADKESAEARGQEIENQYKARLLQGQVNILDLQGQQIKSSIDKINAEIPLLEANKDLSLEQKQKVTAEIHKIESEIRSIDVNVKLAQQKTSAEVRKLLADASLALKQGKYQDCVNHLADMGVYVNGSLFGSIAALASSGGDATIEGIVNTIKGVFTGLFNQVIDPITGKVDELGSEVSSKIPESVKVSINEFISQLGLIMK